MIYVIWGIFILTLSIGGISFLKKRYRKQNQQIYQGIVNTYGTMTVKNLDNIIVKQYYYFIRKNKETPLLIKYNLLVLLPLFIMLIKIKIVNLHISYITLIESAFFIVSLSLSLIDSYMYFKIPYEYIDLFWEQYLSENKKNKLMVVIHYAYTPKEKSRIVAGWYISIAYLLVLIYLHFISLAFYN